MDVILNLIENVAFPIVAFLLVAWYVKYITDKSRQDMNELNDRHEHEMQNMSEAVNNNTKALIELTAYMKKGE